LGDGLLRFSSLVPVPAAGSLGPPIALAAGNQHALAVTSEGAALGWGSNNFGLLGRNTNDAHNLPGFANGLSSVTQLSAFGNFSLALKSDGTVWAFGMNGSGQRGIGSSIPN